MQSSTTKRRNFLMTTITTADCHSIMLTVRRLFSPLSTLSSASSSCAMSLISLGALAPNIKFTKQPLYKTNMTDIYVGHRVEGRLIVCSAGRYKSSICLNKNYTIRCQQSIIRCGNTGPSASEYITAKRVVIVKYMRYA